MQCRAHILNKVRIYVNVAALVVAVAFSLLEVVTEHERFASIASKLAACLKAQEFGFPFRVHDMTQRDFEETACALILNFDHRRKSGRLVSSPLRALSVHSATESRCTTCRRDN